MQKISACFLTKRSSSLPGFEILSKMFVLFAVEGDGSSVSAHRFLPRQLLLSKNSSSGVTASVAKDPATPSRWSPSREHRASVVQLPELFWHASRCLLIRRSLHLLSKPLGVMFECLVFNCIKMTHQVLSPAFMRDRFVNIFPSSQLVLSTLSWVMGIEFSESFCSLPRFCSMGKNSFQTCTFSEEHYPKIMWAQRTFKAHR